jgi:BirA family biotin operon repressor/biotin-[acetyl-CoA-carboxylase] ligase
MGPRNVLDGGKIRRGLKTRRIGSEIIVLETVTSTNDVAAQYADDPENDGLVIVAEEQTEGRGRGGNKWYAGKGKSVLCSIVLMNEGISAELLSLTVAVATAEAIDETARVKWPNDIILNGKKVAGILLESRQMDFGIAYIIGIGINCHQKNFPRELNDIATSIDIETGSVCCRPLLIKRLLSSVEHWIGIAHKKAQQVIERWSELSILLGQRVTVLCDKREFTGTCSGIDPEKGLIIQLDAGHIRFFPAEHTAIAKR